RHTRFSRDWSSDVCSSDLNSVININVPDRPYAELTGIEVTRLGHRQRSDNPVQTINPRGKECYWISAAGEVADAGPGTDFHAIEIGRASCRERVWRSRETT